MRLGNLEGLSGFLAEYPKAAKHGIAVTMGTHPERLSDNITAIPWTPL